MKNWLLYFFVFSVLSICVPFGAKSAMGEIIPAVTVFSDNQIQEMDIEEYTLKALLAQGEITESYEGKKALAVAIRSSGYYLSAYGLKHGDFDVCDQKDCCLELGNMEDYPEEYYNECKSAVEETRGRLLTYNSKPALALFTLCSGRGTASCHDFPYLTGVSEEAPCDKHIILKSFDKSQFDFSFSESDCCLVYDGWGKCVFGVLDGKYMSNNELKALFSLPSDEFFIESHENTIEIKAYGAGNGYGLNLCGAEKMSKNQKTYEEILEFYYPNLDLNNIY